VINDEPRIEGAIAGLGLVQVGGRQVVGRELARAEAAGHLVGGETRDGAVGHRSARLLEGDTGEGCDVLDGAGSPDVGEGCETRKGAVGHGQLACSPPRMAGTTTWSP
jgi:hypothetical protein